MIDILNIKAIDLLDIILVALLLYYVYKLLRGSIAINIFIGIAIIVIIWKLTQALEMEMLSGILGAISGGGVLALIIVFQQEIRKFLLMIGSSNFTTKKSFIKQLKFLKSEINTDIDIKSIVESCTNMGSTHTGAIIVFQRTNSLDFVTTSGDQMQIEANIPIIECIFFKNSPLHDGAIIVKGSKIIATRVVLPLSNKQMPSRFGLRHRAAMGISERTDAVCLIVSEETGKLSYIKDGEFVLYKSTDDLVEILQYDLSQ